MKQLALIFLMIWNLILFGQSDTTYSRIKRLDPFTQKTNEIDTTIHGLQDYWGLFNTDIHFIHGINGAYLPLTYENNKWLEGLPYQFQKLPLPAHVYKTKVPFTRVEGMLGANTEEKLDFLHTQNVLPNWNVGMRYRFSRDETAFSFATSRKWIFQTYSFYESTNGKHLNHLDIQINQGRHQENFGLDSLGLLNELIPNPDLLGVNNENAEHTNKGINITWKHRYYLLNSDSTGNQLFLESDVEFSRNAHLLTDPLPGLSGESYPNFIGDSSYVFDSMMVRTIDIPFGIGWKKNRFSNIASIHANFLRMGRHDSTFTQAITRDFSQTYVANQFRWLGDSLQLLSDFQLNLVGYNAGNIDFQNSISYARKDWTIFVQPNFYSKNIQPHWEQFSNAFYSWDVNLNSEIATAFIAGIGKSWFQLSGEFRTISNQIFFDGNSIRNYGRTVAYSKLEASIDYDKDTWGVQLRGVYQESNDSLISVPQLLSKLRLYKKGFLFKKKMQVEVGITGSIFTSYYAPFYVPEMALLLPQNQILVDAYPIIGAYLSGKVKTARFFLKADHLNEGLMGYNFYSTANFPLNARTFRFGMVIDLFN